MPAREILVRSFFDAVNRGDRDGCARHLLPDCCYVDAQGIELRGAAACANLGAGLKLLDPEFRIDLHSTVRRNDDVLVRGMVHSRDGRFAGETMWKVTLENDLIARFEATTGRFISLIKAVRSVNPDLDGAG